MNKGLFTLIGYVLFILGFLSILFMLVGLQLSPLRWMSHLGPLGSLALKLLMIFGGLIIMYISKFSGDADAFEDIQNNEEATK